MVELDPRWRHLHIIPGMMTPLTDDAKSAIFCAIEPRQFDVIDTTVRRMHSEVVPYLAMLLGIDLTALSHNGATETVYEELRRQRAAHVDLDAAASWHQIFAKELAHRCALSICELERRYKDRANAAARAQGLPDPYPPLIPGQW